MQFPQPGLLLLSIVRSCPSRRSGKQALRAPSDGRQLTTPAAHGFMPTQKKKVKSVGDIHVDWEWAHAMLPYFSTGNAWQPSRARPEQRWLITNKCRRRWPAGPGPATRSTRFCAAVSMRTRPPGHRAPRIPAPPQYKPGLIEAAPQDTAIVIHYVKETVTYGDDGRVQSKEEESSVQARSPSGHAAGRAAGGLPIAGPGRARLTPAGPCALPRRRSSSKSTWSPGQIWRSWRPR